jgi:hypothetical protein
MQTHMGEDEATDTTLRAYGDAVDMAVKAPTLLGIIVALVGITVIWAWRRFSGGTKQRPQVANVCRKATQ